MDPLGEMNMPEGFPYREVCRKGQPRHGPTDRFRVRHPRMEVGHRAKIFAPYNALCGLSEVMAARENACVRALDAGGEARRRVEDADSADTGWEEWYGQDM